MFAYCLNNPVNYYDFTGCVPQAVEDKRVHDEVLRRLCLYNPELRYKKTCIYYNGKNWKDGWGFCDLYNVDTGEVWELKKDTVSTDIAKTQLAGYIAGKLKHHPKLKLYLPYQTIITPGSFEFTRGGKTYNVTYWNEGNGILRYTYTSRQTETARAVETVVALSAMGAFYCYSAGGSGLGWATDRIRRAQECQFSSYQ